MAARVLSDHADEVIVIERDDSDADAGARPGVPQGTQVHALLPAGAVQLERWFPGFNAAAAEAGTVRPPSDGSRRPVLHERRPARRSAVPGGLAGADQHPPVLEAMVRRRVLAIDNVTLVTGRADGLVFDGDRVTGARYVPADSPDAITESADLVVDATGRSSRLSDWLEENGWQRPPMRRMPIKLNYATAMFEYDEQVSRVWSSVSQSSPDPDTGRIARIGGFLKVEGNRWILLISGYGDDRPSKDFQDFVTRCRKDFPRCSVTSPSAPSWSAKSSPTTRPTAGAATSTSWSGFPPA